MSHSRTTDDQQNSSTSGGWLHSMVESLTPSVFTGLWSSREQRQTSSPTSRIRRNGCPPGRQGISRDHLTDNPNLVHQQFEAQPDPDGLDQPLNSIAASSVVSHGAPVPLQQLGELVSRYDRPSQPKLPGDHSSVDANSNDRETASQYSTNNSFASGNMLTNRMRKRPVDATEMDDQESSIRYSAANDFKRFRYGMEPLARPSVSSSANTFTNESSHSLFLDRSQADQSGRLSRMSCDRPPSSLSSASTTLRARISSIGSTGGPGSSALSSRTRRILEELEKMSTPVKDARKLPTLRPWLPERWDVNVNQITVPGSAGTLRGPPLASLSTPTRAQLLSRTMGSSASKPYWRRPNASVSRATSAAVAVPPTSTGRIMKSVDGTNINKFSACTPELEESDSSPHFNSMPLPIAASQVPAAGFLAGNSKFTFAKPVPKSVPVVSAAETPGVSSVKVVENKWTCSACFISNEAGTDKCVCCSGPRSGAPKAESSSTSTPLFGNAFPVSSSDGSNKAFLPKKGWNCSMCFVSNEESADQCVACSEARPGAPKPEKSKALFPGSIFQSSSSSESIATVSKKGWSCSTCFVGNEESADKCVACSEARPGAPKPDSNKSLFSNSFSSTSTQPTENKVTVPKKGWSCSTCFVSNEDSNDQCLACCEPRPGAPKPDKSKALFAGSIFSTSSSAAGNEVAMPKKDWSCTTCFVLNKADKLSCDACQSPKPGSTFKPVSFGLSAVTSQPPAIPAGVTFGIQTHNDTFGEKKTVTFAEPLTTFAPNQPSVSVVDDDASDAPAGPSVSDTSTNDAATVSLSTPTTTTIGSGSSLPSAPLVFGFGASKGTPTPTIPATTTSNGSSSVASGALPVPVFGASAATTTTTSALPVPVSSAFVFGSSSNVASTSSAASNLLTSVPAPIKSEPATVAVSTSSDSLLAPSASLFSFGATAPAAPTTSSTSLFPSATSVFSFGSKPAASASSTSGSVLPSGPAASTFTFGATGATTSSTGSLFAPAAPFSFGASATSTAVSTSSGPSFSTAAAPSFSFGATAPAAVPSTSSVPSFSSAAAPSFSFGATASAAVPSTSSGPSFSTTAAPAFNFGAAPSAAVPSTTSGGSLFASASVPSMFSFAAGAAPSTTTSTAPSGSASIFSFGSRPLPETTDGGARNAFNLPSTFSFGEPSASAAAQSTDASSSLFQFQSAAPSNPFLASTTGASAKQSNTRKMLTAHRRKRQ